MKEGGHIVYRSTVRSILRADNESEIVNGNTFLFEVSGIDNYFEMSTSDFVSLSKICF